MSACEIPTRLRLRNSVGKWQGACHDPAGAWPLDPAVLAIAGINPMKAVRLALPASLLRQRLAAVVAGGAQ